MASLFLSLVSVDQQDMASSAQKKVLRSLPYARWVSAEKSMEKKGVTKYVPQKSYQGINIYNSRHSPHSYLMDMFGNVLHTWTVKMRGRENDIWHHVRMCRNGDLLGISEKDLFVRLDWNSSIKWSKKLPFHHDIDINEDSDIFSLIHKDEILFSLGFPIVIKNDYLVILSPSGEIKKEISLFKILKNEVPLFRLKKILLWLVDPKDFLTRIEKNLAPPREIAGITADILHANTVKVIDKDISDKFKKSNVLICLRNLDSLAVLDIQEEKLIWSWGKNHLEEPHHSTLLESGNILVFDNGTRRGYSRVIELNPFIGEIVWEYTASPPESFFSDWAGASQRLPNGNTLITETAKGRVFEITKDKEIVWEFYNPVMRGKRREVIYRMMRIADTENYPILDKLKE